MISRTAKVYKRRNNYIWKAALTNAECRMKSRKYKRRNSRSDFVTSMKIVAFEIHDVLSWVRYAL